MEPTPFLIIGAIAGSGLTLLIQWYGRRKVKSALGENEVSIERQNELLSHENEQMKSQMSRLEERLSVMERIATDKPGMLASEIESLR